MSQTIPELKVNIAAATVRSTRQERDVTSQIPTFANTPETMAGEVDDSWGLLLAGNTWMPPQCFESRDLFCFPCSQGEHQDPAPPVRRSNSMHFQKA